MKHFQIPGYKIKKKLGQGGMATVYLGLQENLNRLVAIKVLNTDNVDNQRLARRFIKEARALSKLNHPNIVAIHDIGKYNNYYYIVMEYMQHSLKDRLKKEVKIKPESALHITLAVADALFYAHTNGIVHRDIKPDNIMFRKDGSPVLLDFGIAKYIGAKTQLTKTGASIGTPQYMSPEQCNAMRLDGRSDLYSLGVVLFEMLTGRIPYTAKDLVGIAMKHLREPIPQLKGSLKKYQNIIDRMLEKDRKRRVKSKRELYDIIKNLLHMDHKGTNTGTVIFPKRVKSNATTGEKTLHKGTSLKSKTSQKRGTKKAAASSGKTTSVKTPKQRKKKNRGFLFYPTITAIIAIILLILFPTQVKKIVSAVITFFDILFDFFKSSSSN